VTATYDHISGPKWHSVWWS